MNPTRTVPVDPLTLRRLGLDDFAVIDLETTGLDPRSDEIIEFGAVRFVDGKLSGGVAQWLRPQRPLPGVITELTGITQEDVDCAPDPQAVLPALWDRWITGTVAAHNLDFELGFLNAAAQRLSLAPIPIERCLDTLLLARTLLPTLYNHKLEALVEQLEIPQAEAHRARGDAEAAGRVLLALVARALERDPDVLEWLARLAPRGAMHHLLKALEEEAALKGSGRSDLYAKIPRLPRTPPASGPEARPPKPLDVPEIGRALSHRGPLAQTLDRFEERPEQQAMARRVCRAFNEGTFLVAEAGTGVGKSFAYLVPALEWAALNEDPAGRVVLSTRTKTLQDQLFHQDIPRIRQAFAKPWDAVLLKGRQNYLCLRRLDALLTGELPLSERTWLMPLVSWLDSTQTGDLEEVHALRRREVRRRVQDDPEYCIGRRCSFYERCFSGGARTRAKHARLVVVNHALLLADLLLEGAILGDYQHLIVDEAHHFEKSARQALQRSVDYRYFQGIFDELLRRDALSRETGLLVALQRLIPADNTSLLQAVDALREQLSHLRRGTASLFGRLTDQVEVADGTGETPEYTLRQRYGSEAFAAWSAPQAELLEALAMLIQNLFQLTDQIHDALGEAGEEVKDAVSASARQLELLRGSWEWLFAAEDEAYVFWYELAPRPNSLLVLNAAPLDVGEPLLALYERLRTAVFTSATLSVAGDFSYFRSRVGLDRLPERHVHAEDFEHPFDHKSVVHLSVPTYLPEPNAPEFPEALGELLYQVTTVVRRHTLALFTSYKLLRAVQWFLSEKKDPDLFVRAQELNEPRSRILEAFRKGPPASLLLGTDSFWEGIDLPGEALEIVVLTKLPFPVPTDPLVAAEEERLSQLGRSAFAEHSLPQAVLTLRQGFGRLIRSRHDRGAVILADVRVVHKGYGKHFLGALPGQAQIYDTSSSLLDDLKRFLEGASAAASFAHPRHPPPRR